MVGRLPAARTLRVRRGYEFARLQQQLLSLAYEHLLPIVRPRPGLAAAASRPTRPAATPAAAP
jgi:hypothetical protein